MESTQNNRQRRSGGESDFREGEKCLSQTSFQDLNSEEWLVNEGVVEGPKDRADEATSIFRKMEQPGLITANSAQGKNETQTDGRGSSRDSASHRSWKRIKSKKDQFSRSPAKEQDVLEFQGLKEQGSLRAPVDGFRVLGGVKNHHSSSSARNQQRNPRYSGTLSEAQNLFQKASNSPKKQREVKPAEIPKSDEQDPPPPPEDKDHNKDRQVEQDPPEEQNPPIRRSSRIQTRRSHRAQKRRTTSISGSKDRRKSYKVIEDAQGRPVFEDKFEVSKILDKRTKPNGDVYYYVSWKYWPRESSTWEPHDHLKETCSKLIKKFEQKLILNPNFPIEDEAICIYKKHKESRRGCRHKELFDLGKQLVEKRKENWAKKRYKQKMAKGNQFASGGAAEKIRFLKRTHRAIAKTVDHVLHFEVSFQSEEKSELGKRPPSRIKHWSKFSQAELAVYEPHKLMEFYREHIDWTALNSGSYKFGDDYC